MLNIETGRYFSFNKIGSSIWNALETEITYADLCQRMMDEYDVDPKQCKADIESFLLKLLENGTIRVNA